MAKPSTTVLDRPAYRQHALSTPRGDVFAPPARRLPTRTAPVAGRMHRPRWLFMAAHGGSGATLLARLSWRPYELALQAAHPANTVGEQATRQPGDGQPAHGQPAHGGHASELLAFGMSAGRAWPNPQLEPTGLVIVVCRTTMHGLGWARDAAAQYLAGWAPPGTGLVGVVTIADQPGRLPPPIAAAKNLLAGVYPHTWHIPYVPAYRLLTGLPGEDCPPIHPAVEDVLTAIRTTVTPTTVTSKGTSA